MLRVVSSKPLVHVDPGVRGLVEALNAFPGVGTVESCEGHARGAPAWVALVAHDSSVPARLASALAMFLEPEERPAVLLHPYLAYGVGVEWRLVIRHPTVTGKRRLVAAVEAALRETAPG